MAVAAVALVAVGRLERNSAVAAEIRGMERVRALVGPLDQPELTGYRIQEGFDCLVYRRGRNPFALELCAQQSGRVVEAISRLDGERQFFSLTSQPAASTVYVNSAAFNGILRRITQRSG